jgi:ligand-binding SRPBCC domain-containing protein
MKHTLQASLLVPRASEQVFAFFSDPGNLARITPPAMRFQMRQPPERMAAGVEIGYRIRVFGIPLSWWSLIERWDPPRAFVDVQLRGPYKSWRHTHTFDERADGTLIEDTVEYELPLGRLGELLHPLVRGQLDTIFAFRRQATLDILCGAPRHPLA